jgi:hypothetical protein
MQVRLGGTRAPITADGVHRKETQMLLLVVAAATIAIFWRAAREKPQYSKIYYETRSSGVFRTEYAPGFEEYLEHVEKEVSARFTVGPFSPTDDLYANLYHPEVEENWRRELAGHRFHSWIQDALSLIFGIMICAAIAYFAIEMLVHPHHLVSDLFSDPEDQNTTAKLVGWAFAISVCVYMYRSRNSMSRSQGYLDGYSDRCAGPERAMRFIQPPAPRT